MGHGDRKGHWDDVHSTRAPTDVSWYQAVPATSLELIAAAAPGLDAPILDVGAGESLLVDHLLERGYRDLSVLDISDAALRDTRARLGERAASVDWIVADVARWQPPRRYRVWHDRAVLHFLVDEADRQGYVEAVRSGLEHGGTLVLATFAPDGPESCSGLPVVRYDAAGLAALFAGELELVDERREVHHTPWGAPQPFTWVVLRGR